LARVMQGRMPVILFLHLNYLHDRRNEAEHPDRIFNQEETERAVIAVIDVVHEIYSTI